MKLKIAMVGLIVGFLFAFAASGFADDYKRGESDCPVRILAYVAHPVGLAAEYLITRPIHWLVSRPNYNIIFGEKAKPGGKSFVWE